MEVRSYRRVFDLERRIYRIDQLRLNPGGVPVRGVVYFLVTLTACALVGRVPLAGALLAALPWFLPYLAAPAAVAAVLAAIRIEGRPSHTAALALLRYTCSGRRMVGVRRCTAEDRAWHPQELLLLPDGSDRRMRGMLYTGPGALLLAVEHDRELRSKARRLELVGAGMWPFGPRPLLVVSERPRAAVLRRRQAIAIAPGARVLISPRPRNGEGSA